MTLDDQMLVVTRCKSCGKLQSASTPAELEQPCGFCKVGTRVLHELEGGWWTCMKCKLVLPMPLGPRGVTLTDEVDQHVRACQPEVFLSGQPK
jgi:hypothetical protein